VQACKNIYIHNAGTTSKGITIVESGVKWEKVGLRNKTLQNNTRQKDCNNIWPIVVSTFYYK
jgi:hypothetical protein